MRYSKQKIIKTGLQGCDRSNGFYPKELWVKSLLCVRNADWYSETCSESSPSTANPIC